MMKKRRNDVEAVVVVGEQTPLLQQQPSWGGGVTILHDMKAESLKERAVAVTAAISFLTSLVSMFLEAASHPSVYISGLLGCVLAPYAALQQHKLTQVEAMQQTNTMIKVEVSQLDQEHQTLQQTVQELEESVITFQAMEETLETLKGISLHDLEQQLTESKNVLATLNQNVSSQIVQHLIAVLLSIGDDDDFILSDQEIETLMEKFESVPHVKVRHDLLQQTLVEHGRSLSALLHVTRNLLINSQGGDDAIFQLVQEQ